MSLPPPITLSDSDESPFSPAIPRRRIPSNSQTLNPNPNFNPKSILLLDDDPTPEKRRLAGIPPGKAAGSSLETGGGTPAFVAETPVGFGSGFSFVPCSLDGSKKSHRSSDKISGVNGLILVESDDESDKEDGFELCKKENDGFCFDKEENLSVGNNKRDFSLSVCNNAKDQSTTSTDFCQSPTHNGTSDVLQIGEKKSYDDTFREDFSTEINRDLNEERDFTQEENSLINDGTIGTSDKNDLKANKKRQSKEEKARLVEERKRKRQEEKLEREAKKEEAKEMKKLEKEKQKWEKGKLALKSIVAEIDSKVIESGLLGGHLLTRFAEKGFSYRITKNPVEKSILWKMDIPNEVAQCSSVGSEVQYIILVFQAEEFCHLVNNNLLTDHVNKVRNQYPSFTICYVTNKLMSYIKKCEQSQYKNPSSSNTWRSPPVDEVTAKLCTHYKQVHSRHCLDESELAEHIVGLTSSLANCQFRKKLTWLSINANGSIVPKDATEKNLIKKNTWLKALVAMPKVQPRHAIAIWKKYPTMRSLLNVYMDPTKSVHEKEFLLKDLMMEGILGNGERRLGEICSKRVYRIITAQSGRIKTDDVENGADFFAT